jgi:hypothetical protein
MSVLEPTSASTSLPVAPVRPVRLTGRAGSLREPLRSPVSGAECVYWRLRIVEELEPMLRLVHEVASSEPFEMLEVADARGPLRLAGMGEGEDAGRSSGALRIRIVPSSSEIRAPAALHRPGSPGAQAAARHFELEGALCVEEILVRPGEELVADGSLENRAGGAAPFRTTADGHELLGALVRLPGRSALGPVLLPWALGTAAALLGGVGAIGWAAAHAELFPRWRHAVAQPVRSVIRPVRFERRHFSVP